MLEVYSSAPGKLILFGEHAVVYGYPAIVTSLDKRIEAMVRKREEPYVTLHAHDIGLKEYSISLDELYQDIDKIPKRARYAISAVRNFFSKHGLREGLEIDTKGKMNKMVSAGSSSAVTVALIHALGRLYNIPFTNKDLFELGFRSHTLDAQKGVGSGFDVAAGVYGGTFKFKSGGSLIQPLQTTELPLVYAAIPQARRETPQIVKEFKKRIEKYPERYKATWEHINSIVEEAANSLQSRNWEKLGELMNANHGELVGLGVSSKYADSIRYAALEAGAYGAKMTGGYGDNVIALVPEENRKKVIKAMRKEGGKVIEIKTNAEGVRSEA